MYDKTYIGREAADIGSAPAFDPISRIALVVDDEHEYLSGDESGRTLEVQCPYGTQAMADALLSQLGGYVYRPMTAADALLDPAAELGDGVTVNGVYTILGQVDTTFDAQCAAEISAPGEEELESEYPYTSRKQSETDRELAELRSTIAKTSTEILLKVEGLENEYTALSVKVDGVTITDSSGTTLIKGSSIQTSTLYVDAANINGTLTAEQVTLDLTGAITWADLSSEVKNEINDAVSMAEDAADAAADAQDTVDGWRYGSTTYIDSEKIMVTTLMATELLGGEVGLLTSAERTAGGISITGSSSSSYAVELYSNGALRLVSQNGDLYMEGKSGTYLTIAQNGAYSTECVTINGDFLPNGDCYLGGQSGYAWAGAYLGTSPVITSDREVKTDIRYDLTGLEGLFDRLRPAVFKLKAGTAGRDHVGFIAQDVLAALTDSGRTPDDFAGYVDGNGRLGLRYEEFIALLTDQVQRLKERVNRLEGNT